MARFDSAGHILGRPSCGNVYNYFLSQLRLNVNFGYAEMSLRTLSPTTVLEPSDLRCVWSQESPIFSKISFTPMGQRICVLT